MHRYLLIFFVFFISINFNLFSQDETVKPVDFELENTALGNDFWLAMPQNEAVNNDLKAYSQSIYITSPYEANVVIQNEAYGISNLLKISPYIISSYDVGVNLEVTETEEVSHKGIHITSDKPIMVNVVNIKRWSGEAFLAYPSDALGVEYYHCSYFDFNGAGNEAKYKRGGGFVVVATENGTKLTIKLNGKGGQAAKTAGGSEIGETLMPGTMNAGDTYDVRGDGETNAMFDLTGTCIKSNKPVAVLSYHLRTMIPSEAGEDRDNLMEMLLPVSRWGKKYISVQYEREQNGDYGDGDLFRVVNCEDNTEIGCEFFDPSTMASLGVRRPTLNTAGSFAAYDDPEKIGGQNKLKSIRGVSVWNSTKPFQLMQYAFSYPWDGDRNWSPQMTVIPPTAQYVKNAIVMAPKIEGISFNRAILTLFAIGDPDDAQANLIKSIKLNGIPVSSIGSPNIVTNNINGTNIYWTRLNINVGETHVITSDTKISGYFNALGSANSFGWPIGMGTNYINGPKIDDIPPTISKEENCGNFIIQAYDKTSNDYGISKIILIDYSSDNFELTLKNPEDFIPNSKIAEQEFYLDVIDRSQPATAVYAVLDRAGNITYDTVSSVSETASFSEEEFDFGKIRVLEKKTGTLTFQNTSPVAMIVNDVSLKDGGVFSINTIETPFTLKPDSSISINIAYEPISEAGEQVDSDSLIIISECGEYSAAMKGLGIMSHISVQNYNFGDDIEIHTSKCLEEINQEGFEIKNTGTAVLTVSGMNGIEPPFVLTEPTTPELPADIQPGESIYIKSICFVPDDTLEHSIEVIIESNAGGEQEQNTSIITGKGWQEPESVLDDPISDNDNFNILPNPAGNEDITIKFFARGTTTLKIIDSRGNEIETPISEDKLYGFQSIILNSRKLSSGAYMVRLSTGERTFSGKLIINK